MSVALAVVRMLVVLLACAPAPAFAQIYPAKQIRVIDAYPAGGSTDWIARIIGPKFAENTGQHWIVDNRPGAQGIIGVQLASKAPPDGYTLLMFTASHAIHASFYKNLPYDMLKDFAPVSLTSLTVNLLLVNPGVPANSVKELIALAKARPGQLSFGSAGLGSQNHLAMELFKYMTATNMAHIPYKATQSAVIDVLTGRIDLMVGPLPAFMPHIKSGRARALAVSSPKRALALPDLPTVAESGVPGYETTNSTGVLAPAGTSPDIISKLNAEIVKVLNQPEMKERLISNGAEPVGSSPEEFGEYLRRETAKWANLIKDIGLVPEQW